MKDLRAAGSNLTRIWAIMDDLRKECTPDDASYDEDKLCLTFPDPLAPPKGATVHLTRTTVVASGLMIADSAQMVPVLVGLIHDVLLSGVIRQAVDDGVSEGKELAKTRVEAMKKENELWDSVKSTILGPVVTEEAAKEKTQEEKAQAKAKNAEVRVGAACRHDGTNDRDSSKHNANNISSVCSNWNALRTLSPQATLRVGRYLASIMTVEHTMLFLLASLNRSMLRPSLTPSSHPRQNLKHA